MFLKGLGGNTWDSFTFAKPGSSSDLSGGFRSQTRIGRIVEHRRLLEGLCSVAAGHSELIAGDVKQKTPLQSLKTMMGKSITGWRLSRGIRLSQTNRDFNTKRESVYKRGVRTGASGTIIQEN